LHIRKSAETWVKPDVDALVERAHGEARRNPVLED
jgi:hypothetical protein